MVIIIQEIDENNVGDNFDKIIEQGPSVARFHMDGCGHCTAMEPAWNETKNPTAIPLATNPCLKYLTHRETPTHTIKPGSIIKPHKNKLKVTFTE